MFLSWAVRESGGAQSDLPMSARADRARHGSALYRLSIASTVLSSLFFSPERISAFRAFPGRCGNVSRDSMTAGTNDDALFSFRSPLRTRTGPRGPSGLIPPPSGLMSRLFLRLQCELHIYYKRRCDVSISTLFSDLKPLSK